MDNNKLTLHQATMAKNLPGATKCINSVYSAIVLNTSIPFTRDDLHQLYDYDKALYKAAIEKNDNFSDDTKERKKDEIEVLFSEAEMLDIFDALRCLLSAYQFGVFVDHFEYNYRSSISEAIKGDNVELIEANRYEKYLAEIHSLITILIHMDILLNTPRLNAHPTSTL